MDVYLDGWNITCSIVRTSTMFRRVRLRWFCILITWQPPNKNLNYRHVSFLQNADSYKGGQEYHFSSCKSRGINRRARWYYIPIVLQTTKTKLILCSKTYKKFIFLKSADSITLEEIVYSIHNVNYVYLKSRIPTYVLG